MNKHQVLGQECGWHVREIARNDAVMQGEWGGEKREEPADRSQGPHSDSPHKPKRGF